jgi:ferredoxin
MAARCTARMARRVAVRQLIRIKVIRRERSSLVAMILKEKEVAPPEAHVAAQGIQPKVSRRAFLRGDWNASPEAPSDATTGLAVIGPACLALNRVVCRSCAEHCEPHAIHFRLAPGGIAVPLVRAERCDGCAACLAVCPVSAIVLQAPEDLNQEAA